MPTVRLALADDYPRLPVLIGLDGPLTRFIIDSGRLPPPPAEVEAVIDTGATVSSASAALNRRLKLPVVGGGVNQTAGGPVEVDLYSVSLGVLMADRSGSVVVDEALVISEMAVPIPGVEFLIGMDVLRKCRLTLDGPAGTFALEV